MRKIFPPLLIFCLLLTACATVTASAAHADVAPMAPLTLYPAYLQTPLDMPVVLEAETSPAGKKLVWTSADPSIAAVDAEGCVTPVAAGETAITCALADDAGVTATCGVWVVEEGNILLWAYPPEPVNLDAIIAEMEAAAVPPPAQAIPWPDAWPGDLPKMEGVVTDAYGETTESADGLLVYMTVQGLDVAKAYVGELVALGFEAEEMPVEDYVVRLKGKGYDIYVIYSDSTKECSLFVQK